MPASPTLRDMIQEAARRGQTYEQLEKNAVDPQTGKRVSRAMINNIANNKVDRMPYEYHLRAIAAALGKPYTTVGRAAIAQWMPALVAEEADADLALLSEARELTAQAARLTEAVKRQVEAGERPGQRETA